MPSSGCATMRIRHVSCGHPFLRCDFHADAEKARASRNIRRGKGKMRNRRYTTRKGPLVVYSEDSGIVRSFRNIPGVDVARVDRLNLLQVGLQQTAHILLTRIGAYGSNSFRVLETVRAAVALRWSRIVATYHCLEDCWDMGSTLWAVPQWAIFALPITWFMSQQHAFR